MGFAEDVLKKVFGKRQMESTLDSGVIKRDAAHIQAFNTWREPYGSELIKELRRGAVLSRQDLRDDLKFVWLKRQGAEGFQCRLDLLDELPENYSFVLELLKQRMNQLSYQLYNSGYTYETKGEVLTKTEWYYFKTPLKELMKPAPYDQLYGNIRITLTELESRTELKLLCTTYPDRSYKPARPFDDFIEVLFSD